MKTALILPTYIWWHYVRAPYCIIALTLNFAGGILYFFSITLLLKTLFSPWRRLSEDYPENFNFGEIATSLVVNSLMRVVGAVMRTITIITGLFFTLLSFIMGILFFVYWLLMPVALVFLLTWGSIIIFVY
ncbi:MAG: hypothetical protein ACQESA_02160 [Patescibacteria group bacterium]